MVLLISKMVGKATHIQIHNTYTHSLTEDKHSFRGTLINLTQKHTKNQSNLDKIFIKS